MMYFFFGLLPEGSKLNIEITNLHGVITPGRRKYPIQEVTVNGKFEYISFGVAREEDHTTFWKAKMIMLSDWEQNHSTYM